MSAWREVDAWVRQQYDTKKDLWSKVENDRLRLSALPYTSHLARAWPPYSVTMKDKTWRAFRSNEVYRLGASTRSRLVLHSLCGDLQARGPEHHHRLTVKRNLVTCDACLVVLDQWLESGAATVDESMTVTNTKPLPSPKPPSPSDWPTVTPHVR